MEGEGLCRERLDGTFCGDGWWRGTIVVTKAGGDWMIGVGRVTVLAFTTCSTRERRGDLLIFVNWTCLQYILTLICEHVFSRCFLLAVQLFPHLHRYHSFTSIVSLPQIASAPIKA